MDEFNFSLGDVVLAEWEDKLFYAKIQKIDNHDQKCVLIFDDDSVEECPFSRIHSVTETTAEIVCIICKDGSSSRPNEIVLCDKCGIGYHQSCHEPNIPATALEFDAPWMCLYCTVGEVCPYLTNPFEAPSSKRTSKKRRPETVQSENCLSSGYSTEEEATNPKQSKVPVLPDMSGFYYATHHRDGPRPRGRPPFSHKTAKSFSERRGQRSVGRPSGRPSNIRDRDPHEEHGYDPEEKNFSQHYRHSEMPRQGRYGSPNRLSKRIEEGESEKVTTASRNSPIKTSVSSEEISAAAKLNKMQRRDTPREKQRLTQDLARQKRLLSEDIARAELLHREQLSNKLDKNERQEQGRDFEELNDLSREDLQFVPQIYDDTRTDKIATMYEKVYGNLSPDMSDHSQCDEMLTEVPKKDTNLIYDQERKSSFGKYKVANEKVQEIKNIEFVNEAKVEVRGTNCLAQENLNGVLETNGTQKLEPLKFENVTDDELIPSDNDPGEKSVNCLTFGAVNGDIMDHSNSNINNNGDLMHLLNKPQLNHNERTSSIECESAQSGNNDSDLNQETNLEQIDCVNCECVTSEKEKEGNTCLTNNNEVGFLSQSDNDPEHSNVKAVSKLEQLLEEPDMQCEHSSKRCDESLGTGTELDEHNDFKKILASSIAQVEKNKDTGKIKQVTGVENDNSENATVCPVAVQEQKDSVHKEEPSADGRRGDIETDQSNNEGMSDAEELSDSDLYPAPQRGKVKKRRRRKHKTSKQHTNSTVKSSNTCSTLKGRSKSGRTGGRGKKSNKKSKSIQESDSDDAFGFLASPKNIENHAAVDGAHDETTPYQGHMVKEDSSSDPPPVLFEESAHINETFEALDNICENSKDESEKESSVETNVVDNEKKNELLKESDKNIKSNEVPSLTKSDHNDLVREADENNQEIFSLTSAERQLFEEQERKEKIRKEKRFAARQKRRNEEQKDNERSTPPHLVSQNRFARDLPRHNWLVERLLQQNQLCEDTLKDESTTTVNEEPVDYKGEDLNTNENNKEDNDNFGQSESNISSPKPVPEKQLDAESSDEDSSSPKDEFQSELHRSFLRRRYPTKVPRGPPKLKPATPECNKNSVSGPQHLNSLKHKLLSPKENPIMEPIPKLRKISEDCDKSDSSAETIKIESQLDMDAIQPQNTEKIEESRAKEDNCQEKNITPIEVLNSDDEKEKKNHCSESNECNATEPTNEEEKIESNVDKTDSNDNLSLSAGREPFNFSSPKKPVAQKVVNSVPPTILSTKSKDIQSSMDKLSSSMHMAPHHRAAILIPLMPMHEGGLPMTPSMGPPSPHMKGYPPRTFAPHLISHSTSTLQPPGLFQSPHSPSGRYAGNACMHHVHGGPKGGISCKRDVNCPFHGSTPRGMHSGILGIPSHHSPVPAFSQHSHISDHMPPIFSSEHREGEKHPCTHPDCKPCQAGKESPSSKFREKELESSAKISPQIPKVVKPIAHVPGKRPPLMLSHLQQPLHSSRHPPNVEGYNGEKDRRPPPGLDSLLSRNQEKPSNKPARDSIPPGFQHLSEKRPFNHPLTLSELNRRREEEAILKARIGEHGPEYLQRPGNFAVPRPSSPLRLSSKSSSIFSPRDTATLMSNQSPPLKDAEALRRFGRERERAVLLPEHLKNGPPRLRSVEDPKDMSDLRLIADRQRREDLALRDNILSKERPMLLRQMRGKETTSPEVKRLVEKAKSPRLTSEHFREDSRNLEIPHSRLHPGHESTGVFSLTNAAHSLGEFHKNIEETRANIVRDEKQGFQVLRNPEIGPSHRNFMPSDKNIGMNEFERRQRVELLHCKEQEKKELTDKELQNRSPSAERERQGERLSERDKSPFRLANISPPSLRKDSFNDKMIAMDPRGRSHHRFVPRGLSLQELQIHRRREELRGVEPSHRELLSRMAMSSRAAVPHLVNPFPERKEGLFEGSEHLRIPLGLHQRSPPRGISRDFPPSPSSRLAVERLAAAAAQAKPGLVMNEKTKDVPPHLREEMERERERERHRLSLEQLEANRRLLHQELKDKMNPLVFRSEGQSRSRERERELEVLRTREKLLLERERFYAMERLADERKRKFSGEQEFQLGMTGRRVSPPNARLSVDREEHERRKRLKLSSCSPSPTSGVSSKLAVAHSQLSVSRASPGTDASRKEDGPPRSSPKSHGSVLPHMREVQEKEDTGDQKIRRSRDLEMILNRGASIHNGPNVPGGPFFDSRESMWLRERAIRLNQEEINRKRPVNPSEIMAGFMPPKGGISIPQGHKEPGRAGKKDNDGFNSCSVCKREASFLCSGCQSSWYCSPECQLSAWGSHSLTCGQNQRP